MLIPYPLSVNDACEYILTRENFANSGNDELTHKNLSVRSVLAITAET